MNLFEPTLPSFPVNVTGEAASSAKARSLHRLRHDSCYGAARLALRATFLLEVLVALFAVVYVELHRGAGAALLTTFGCAVALTASFAALEVGTALLDCADLQLSRRRVSDAEV